VSAEAVGSPVARVLRLWLAPATWVTIADVFAVLTALALPWSTSPVAIFVLCWLGSVALGDGLRCLPAIAEASDMLPAACAGRAGAGRDPVVGCAVGRAALRGRPCRETAGAARTVLSFRTLGARDVGIVGLPGVLRPADGDVVDRCICPEPYAQDRGEVERGIFVKNYIDQSQEFALCAVALAYPIISLLRAKNIRLALLLGALSLGFVVNMAFVIVSRTAIVTIPIMLAVFALLHLRRRTSLIILGVTIVLGGVLWFTMTDLRWGPKRFVRDYKLYKTQNDPTSIGIRLEF
jgi:O-antigen ligase